jgi:asparagine synthase (glutamine-hydrolysing)
MQWNRFLGVAAPRDRCDRITGSWPGAQTLTQCRDGKDYRLAVSVSGAHFGKCFSEGIMVVVRGYMVLADQRQSLFGNAAAGYVHEHYQRSGAFSCDRAEGSYTIAIMDAIRGRVFLYRNLVGNGFLYYTRLADGIAFGSNLALLTQGETLVPNSSSLPTLFLYRYPTGRETLFAGIYRLMPGESVTFERGNLLTRQRQTLEDLFVDQKLGRDAVDSIDATMAQIMSDYKLVDANSGNLLSGGVDSSYLQAHWNRISTNETRRSFCVTLEHPRTKPDREYALTASKALGTRHLLIPATGSIASYLVETIAHTGELPNHAQSCYFGLLGRSLIATGVRTALCGEGADSLFGSDTATTLHTARLLRALLPSRAGRRLAQAAAKIARRHGLESSFRLANSYDDLTWSGHPINEHAVFTEWNLLLATFGHQGVSDASEMRRRLLAQYRVQGRVQEQVHAIAYLTDGMESSALWSTLVNTAGAELLCPFLDSRLLKVAVNTLPAYRFPFRRPKLLLKRALARYAPREIAFRKKLGFGQPIFEWLAPGGPLYSLVEGIDRYEFLDAKALESARARPSWFLYSLLCYDLWHKIFIAKTLTLPSESQLRQTPETARPLPDVQSLQNVLI